MSNPINEDMKRLALDHAVVLHRNDPDPEAEHVALMAKRFLEFLTYGR